MGYALCVVGCDGVHKPLLPTGHVTGRSQASASTVKQSFRDLEVWQKAIELTEFTYRLTADFPKHELFGLTSQMRRAAVSIASNVAEGSARGSRKDFRHFVLIAKGSICELETQLIIAIKLGYISDANAQAYEALTDRVARMLSGLARALKQPTP